MIGFKHFLFFHIKIKSMIKIQNNIVICSRFKGWSS